MKKFIPFFLLIAFAHGLNAQSYVEDHILASSYLLESRAISVSVPADYNSNNKNYPVLYILDGEYLFSYARGTVDFLTNDFGYLPELIVVSIFNTDRNRDLYVTLKEEDGYTNFINFLTKELFTFINEKYRVNGFEILYGWSSGSGICNYILTTQPQFVDGYILTGTGIGPSTAKFIQNNITKSTFQNKYLYANAEDVEPRRSALLRYQELIETINPKGLNRKFEIIERSNHVEVMAKGLDAGLKFVLSDFYIPDSVSMKGSQAIIDYYEKINHNYGFEVNIPIGAINESASFLWYNDKKDAALQLLNHGVTLWPCSAVLYGSLAELYQLESNYSLAKKYYQMAIDNSTNNINDYLKYKSLLEGIK